jgi:hypothetical protein
VSNEGFVERDLHLPLIAASLSLLASTMADFANCAVNDRQRLAPLVRKNVSCASAAARHAAVRNAA